MKKVGLLYDSMSDNTGDIAIGIALQQGLSARGIDSEVINPYDSNYVKETFDQIIVGGGQLLRNPGDKFYDNFRIKGEYILNSVGVSGTESFKYLNDYKYISTRSSYESNVLSNYVEKDRIKTMPCTTTILSSPKYDLEKIIGSFDKEEILVGIHLVPDIEIMCPDIIEIINDIPYKKVFIPFTHYNHDKSFMENLPIDKNNCFFLEDDLNPLELHSVIGQMTFSFVCSLHASIFSYSQNVPFLSMYQKKVNDYFLDRNLERYVFSSQTEVIELLKEFKGGNFPNFSTIVTEDKEKVNEYLDNYVNIINESTRGSKGETKVWDYSGIKLKEQEELINQKVHVIQGRDRLTHYLNHDIMNLKELNNSLHAENEALRHANVELKNSLDKILTSKYYRAISLIAKPFVFLKGLVK